MSLPNTDCYFYYYSTCTKGDTCQFRHEPLARNQEIECKFWKLGKCTEPHCSFRHMVVEKKRTTERCYWESQPSGCLKPHCPFLHTPKDPYDPEKVGTTALTKAIIPHELIPPQGTGKIIVNRNKLEEIMQSTPNRMVVPPKKPSVKDRLGQRVVKEELLEIDEYSDPEEENLRLGAISTLDLRKRIGAKRKFSEDEDEEEFSNDEPETKKVLSVVKKVKKEKKEKKKKKDKDKEKDLKSERKKKKIEPGSVALKTLREIAPASKVDKKRRSFSDKSDDEDEGDTLAKRIAAERAKDGPGSKGGLTKKRSKSRERKKSKTDVEPERSVEMVKSSPIKDSEYEFESRKMKVQGKSSKSSLNDPVVNDKETVQSVIADVDALLKSSDPLPDSKANDSKGELMAELDDFINS